MSSAYVMLPYDFGSYFPSSRFTVARHAEGRGVGGAAVVARDDLDLGADVLVLLLDGDRVRLAAVLHLREVVEQPPPHRVVLREARLGGRRRRELGVAQVRGARGIGLARVGEAAVGQVGLVVGDLARGEVVARLRLGGRVLARRGPAANALTATAVS